MHVSAGFCKFDALFVCHGEHRKGCALSEQRLSKWVFDIIMQAYRPPPPPSCGDCGSVCSLGLQLRLEYGLLLSLFVWVIQVLHTFSGSQEEYNETNVTKVL